MSSAFVLALMVVSQTLAFALPWDNTDPHGTGCDSSASTVWWQNVTGGVLEHRYSSSCQTAWARYTCLSPSCTSFDIKIMRNQDGYTVWNGVRWPTFMPQNAVLYTNQIYDGPGYTTQACFIGQNDVPVCSPAF